MPPEDNREESPRDRRSFFREALFRAMRPAAEYLEGRLPPEIRNELLGGDQGDVNHLSPLLRPPGALAEREFLDTCHRCGRCAEHCPADAIALVRANDPRAMADESAAGTPFIDPDQRACVICDDLSCMKACPSGALQLVDRFAIRVGFAIVDHAVCVRSRGDDCTACIEFCPIGNEAIRIGADGRVDVIDPSCTGTGCTGCGKCQEVCPTRPTRAIRIRAYSERRI
ncbi:MAG: 4Fe-4S dicluster domain-containing protein [Phycisphaerae bacterium]|nr:4Fe-4S dicluster domain-containing protein [Phycisphaerae bacterium]